MMVKRFAFLVAILILPLLPARGAEPITVSAAISLKESLTRIGSTFEKQTSIASQFNFGATGHLLAQIREGAPVDVFIAASEQQMDQADMQNLIDPATRIVVAGNEMVLIVPRDSKLELKSFDELAGSAVKRLAIGQPKTVPAGEYGTQVLQHLKLDALVSSRIVYGCSVRQVLDYVARGEVDAGIVYATDALEAGDDVRVMATADPSWHEPIHYVAAVVKSSKHAEKARPFIGFLRGKAAQKILADHGFVVPAPSSTQPSAPPTPPAAN
jgi:molybdate transport system substrate-binding protein